MRWGDRGVSGGPAGGGQTLSARQAVLWAQPLATPVPTPDSQARPGAALHTQSRGAHPAFCWRCQGPSLRVRPPRRRAW